MFTENEEVTRQAALLWDTFGQSSPGDVVPYDEIATVIGVPYNNGDNVQFRTVLNKYRRRLQGERDIVTRCVRGVGLRLLTHREAAVEVPPERSRKMYRQGSRMLKETDGAAAASILTEHQRAMLARTRATVRVIRRDAGKARRDHMDILKAPETLPIRKR